MLPLHHAGVPDRGLEPRCRRPQRRAISPDQPVWHRWWRLLVTIQARGRYEQPLCTSALPPHREHDSNVRRARARTSASKAGRLAAPAPRHLMVPPAGDDPASQL